MAGDQERAASVPSNPLARTEFLVLEFDPYKASLRVLNDLGYSVRNREDAMRDAEAAAAAARAKGQPQRYCVIRVATEAVFPP
jgi:hypothetical protein